VANLQLPLWVEYVKALGGPIVALIAACIGGGIASQQWRTARNKLKLDLFDKRLKVYQHAVELLQEIWSPTPTEVDKYLELSRGVSGVVWLFDSDVSKYVNELVERGRKAMYKPEVDYNPMTDEQKVVAVVTHFRTNMRSMEADAAVLNNVFAPYLKVQH
jgi:hypothetical protein